MHNSGIKIEFLPSNITKANNIPACLPGFKIG